MIKQLAQLKRALVKGTEFEIVDHCQKEHIGERRIVLKTTSQGLYSGDQNGSEGQRDYLDWGYAAEWEFREDGVCAVYIDEKHAPSDLIVAFRMVA